MNSLQDCIYLFIYLNSKKNLGCFAKKEHIENHFLICVNTEKL